MAGASPSSSGVSNGDGEQPGGTLDLAALERRPPRIAVTAAPSVFAVAADIAGAGRGVPSDWIARARAELEPADVAVLAPIGAPRGFAVPDAVTMTNLDAPEGVPDALERLAALPEDVLLDNIALARDALPPGWDKVVQEPRPWLTRYARALRRVWEGIREPWAAAAALLDREVERVETARARTALPELMVDIHQRAVVRDGLWRFPDPEIPPLQVRDGGPAFVPILGGPGTGWVVFPEDGVLGGILYALPGATRLLTGAVLPPAAALDALLGAQRAAILRMLDRPLPAGQVARALQLTPGAGTHHVTALEHVGLVLRERDGRSVIVHRTTRGTALLGLYGDRPDA